jgi:hypothetical protein
MEDKGAEVAARLDAAIEGETTVETPTTAETVETVETATESPVERAKTIPYQRFQEVVGQKNDLQGQLDNAVTQYQTANESLSKMTAMLDAAKEDVDLLKDIRALANDPEMLPHLEKIDKRIRGIEEEIEETGEVDESKIDKATKILERKQAQLADQMADQAEDLLAQRADQIADKWLESLPEEYTDEDREVISKLWSNNVEWDDVVESPEALDQYLADTFQTTIQEFGTPRGGLINPEDPDSYEVEVETPPEETPEQQFAQLVEGKNYSGVKDGQAEVSDSDFAADLAAAMRMARNR